MKLAEMDRAAVAQMKEKAEQAYAAYQARGLKLNMARGKPSPEQMALTIGLQQTLAEFNDENGEDVRNYGNLTGLTEMRRLFGQIMGLPEELVIIGGSSSLNLMYDTVNRAYIHGVLPGMTPWCKLDTVKCLCPVPGYDRHFCLSESFGIENVPVPMTENGPDMDVVERMVAEDASIKGMWCVPMYSNPGGITYSDEAVRRIAALEPAAEDFRVFWDNAYAVHHLDFAQRDHLLNLYEACLEQGNEERAYFFASTSKVTVAGAGIAAMAMGPKNYAWTKQQLGAQTIGYDKVNQLRHAYYLPDMAAVEAVMRQHARIIGPKFELVLEKLDQELAPLGLGAWNHPKGGYFISFFAPEGTAKRVVSLCKEAGVVLTGAGATYPYGKDPADSNIRIAPTFPPLSELEQAMEIFCLAVKIAASEKMLAK